MNSCPNCGANLNPNEDFCRVCGAKLSSTQNNFYNNAQQPQQMNSQNINLQQQSVNINSQLINNVINNNGIYKLTLTRPKSFVGCLLNVKIYIDGEKIGVLKNDDSITFDVTGGNHHISLSNFSDYTIQILDNATATVIVTDSKKILLQDLNGVNLIKDERVSNTYSKITNSISYSLLVSSIVLLIPALFYSQFMSSVTILLLIIAADIFGALIGILLAMKDKSKLGYNFKGIITSYIGTIIINVISIVVCLIIKSF